jgi:hypothetical protein
MARIRYRKRTFLAPISSGSRSFVWAEVESSDGGTYTLGNYVLVLADCKRQVQLEFSLSSVHSRKESLAKADLLLEVLTDFRQGLHEEAALIEKRKAVKKVIRSE